MAGEADKPLSKEQALEVNIARAYNREGPLWEGGPNSYSAWYDKAFNDLQRQARQSGQEPNAAAINQMIEAQRDEAWAKPARQALASAKVTENNALNITSENAQGLFGSLFSGDFKGALMGLLMQFKPVQKFIATVIGWIGSKFGGGESLSFAEAGERVDNNNALSASGQALAQAGYGDAAQITEALGNTKAPVPSAAATAGEMPANVPGLIVVPGTGAEPADHANKAAPMTVAAKKPTPKVAPRPTP